MRKFLITAGGVALAVGVAIVFLRQPGLSVEVLDVAGYTDDMPVWMPFRLTLGISNGGRAPIVVSRIEVEPDLDGFTEALGGSGVLETPLRIDPGSRASYQAAVTLLNANQLPERTYDVVFRVRVERDGGASTFDFPAEFDYVRDPKRRVLRPAF